MRARGFDTTQHRSVVLTAEQLLTAHAIYCVSQGHVDYILSKVGEQLSRCMSLGQNIPDPWHGPLEYYQQAADAIIPAVNALLESEWTAGTFASLLLPSPSATSPRTMSFQAASAASATEGAAWPAMGGKVCCGALYDERMALHR
jgi:hypothetical protein